MEAAPPATSRHTNPPLWLLPSGPDQVHGLSLREDQQGHHRVALRACLNKTGAQYKHSFGEMQTGSRHCNADCQSDQHHAGELLHPFQMATQPFQ